MTERLREADAMIEGDYRYYLRRTWDESKKNVCFIGLNPSTADATNDDPTIRRMIQFAKDWGYGTLFVVNLFALRSTDPKALKTHTEPIGQENDNWIKRLVRNSEIAVACWGNHGSFMDRSKKIMRMFPRLKCFGLTKVGEPKHPLYLSKDSTLSDLGSEE